MGRTFEVDVADPMRSEFAASRLDLGLTEECRQFPYRIAFLCFAGDAIVAFACLLAAFWLRFDTGLREFGEDAYGIILSTYSNYIIFGSVSLLLVLAQKRMYDGPWLLHRYSSCKDVFVVRLIWGAGFLGFSLFFKFRAPLSRDFVVLATVMEMAGVYSLRRLVYSDLRRESI